MRYAPCLLITSAIFAGCNPYEISLSPLDTSSQSTGANPSGEQSGGGGQSHKSLSDLKAEIDSTPSDGALSLSGLYVIKCPSIGACVNLSKPITIDGQNATIQLSMSNNIFITQSASNVILSRLNAILLTDGAFLLGQSSGSSYTHPGLTITDCKFGLSKGVSLSIQNDNVTFVSNMVHTSVALVSGTRFPLATLSGSNFNVNGNLFVDGRGTSNGLLSVYDFVGTIQSNVFIDTQAGSSSRSIDADTIGTVTTSFVLKNNVFTLGSAYQVYVSNSVASDAGLPNALPSTSQLFNNMNANADLTSVTGVTSQVQVMSDISAVFSNYGSSLFSRALNSGNPSVSSSSVPNWSQYGVWWYAGSL